MIMSSVNKAKLIERLKEGNTLQDEELKLLFSGESVYDDWQMNQIRCGLEDGLDVSIYIALDKDGRPVYDDDQMEKIRKGLASGVDVSIYTVLNKDGEPVYNAEQMFQICNGLEKGRDVSHLLIHDTSEPEVMRTVNHNSSSLCSDDIDEASGNKDYDMEQEV